MLDKKRLRRAFRFPAFRGSTQKVDCVLAREASFSSQRHKCAFRYIAIGSWNDCATPSNGIVVNEVTARCVIENEAVLFKKSNNLSRLDRRQFRHYLLLYQLGIL